MQTCRADRAVTWPWLRRLPLLAAGLFVAGFVGTTWYVDRLAAARRFADVQAFDLWVVLLAVLVGLALSCGAYYVVWTAGLAAIDDGHDWRTYLDWAWIPLVVLLMTFALLFIGTDSAAASLDKTVAQDTRPITLLVAVSQLPGLAAFFGLRRLANTDDWWTGPGTCPMRLVQRLRAELRRLLATLGGFLTLLVITVGMRRKAFLALGPDTDIPAEVVLLYGLLFAALTGGFYALAAGAIDARSDRLLDRYAPLPDPADAGFRDRMAQRDAVAAALGTRGSWASFQATVVIAAPLLTALIGSATGG